ncbi:MAG: BLUF domain-containing protein [Parvularcula sp.]|jgi:hypothetical protein|nr:BLUF domain-containing protein [Parvularcula sp.]
MISQYVYVSTAQGLSRADVEDILETCARNNVDLGVTGLLLYNGRNFLQLLEGEGVTLDALMSKIEEDPRHSGVTTLYEGEKPARDCADWAMKRIVILDEPQARKKGLDEDLPAGLDPSVRELILNFAILN